MFYDSRCKYFDISIILELHFLLVRTSFNHISANFEKKLDVLLVCHFTSKNYS